LFLSNFYISVLEVTFRRKRERVAINKKTNIIRNIKQKESYFIKQFLFCNYICKRLSFLF